MSDVTKQPMDVQSLSQVEAGMLLESNSLNHNCCLQLNDLNQVPEIHPRMPDKQNIEMKTKQDRQPKKLLYR